MNIIKVNDFDSMQAITLGLARNNYFVTSKNVTDANYQSHWEIKYCEFSEIKEKSANDDDNDWDKDQISIMDIYNKNNTKDVKCETSQDEKPLVENEKEFFDTDPLGLTPRHNTPESKPIVFDLDEKPLVEKDKVDTKSKHKSNSYGLMPRDKTPDVSPIPQQDVSDIITDEPMTVITSVSGN